MVVLLLFSLTFLTFPTDNKKKIILVRQSFQSNFDKETFCLKKKKEKILITYYSSRAKRDFTKYLILTNKEIMIQRAY